MTEPLVPPNLAERSEYEEHLRRRRWKEAYYLLGEGLNVTQALQIRFVLAHGPEMPEDIYWDLVRDAYKTAFAGLHLVSTDQLRHLFTCREGRERLMSSDERRILADLDEEIVLYRGYHNPERLYRFSWSSSEQDAARFALLWHDREGGGDPLIARARVKKHGILAIWNFEAEALVDPDYVHVESTYPVSERYWHTWGYDDHFRKRFGRDPEGG